MTCQWHTILVKVYFSFLYLLKQMFSPSTAHSISQGLFFLCTCKSKCFLVTFRRIGSRSLWSIMFVVIGVLFVSLLQSCCSSSDPGLFLPNDLDILDHTVAFVPSSFPQENADVSLFSDEPPQSSDLDLFSLAPDLAQSNLNLDLKDPSSVDLDSDIDLFDDGLGELDNGSVLTADSGVVDMNDYCPTINGGQSRKRNAECRPAKTPASNNMLTLPNLLPSETDEEKNDPEREENKNAPSPRKGPGYDMDKCIKHGKIPILMRTWDVCCDGPRGPFSVDKYARLIYFHIENCELGVSCMHCSLFLRLTRLTI